MERQRPLHRRNASSSLRKAAAQTHAFRVSLNVILKTSVQRRVNNLISLPREVEARHRLRKVDAAWALYREGESLCSMMLAIAGIGIVLYSASMFPGVTDQARVPRGRWSVWPLTADRHWPKLTTLGVPMRGAHALRGQPDPLCPATAWCKQSFGPRFLSANAVYGPDHSLAGIGRMHRHQWPGNESNRRLAHRGA